jgi:hypothetical protein
MHHTIEPQTETPKRFQCRHIFTDGHRCGSPCLRGEDLCYYHHTTRKPAPHPRTGKARRAAFEIPLPEDRSAIQHSIGQVLQRIAANDIDPRRAGLLLYGLQIASLNLPKPPATQPELVEETTSHPQLGTLAPPAEVGKNTQHKSPVALLIDKMLEDDRKERQAQQQDAQQHPTPQVLPTLQARADEAPQVNPQISQPRDHTNRLNYQQHLLGPVIASDGRRPVLPQPNALSRSDGTHRSALEWPQVSLVTRNKRRPPLTAPGRRRMTHDEVQGSSSLDLLPGDDRNVQRLSVKRRRLNVDILR